MREYDKQAKAKTKEFGLWIGKKKRRLVSPLLFFMPFSLEFPNVLLKLPCAYHFFFCLLVLLMISPTFAPKRAYCLLVFPVDKSYL